MSTPSSSGLYQSSNSSTSTLRPRAARLISYLGDDPQDSAADASAVSTSSASTPPRFPSRGVSPVTELRRTKSSDKGKASRPAAGSSSGSSSSRPSLERPSQQGLWDPWNSIQGFASTLLGNELGNPTRSKSNGAFRQPVWMKQDKSYASKKSALSAWGPSTEPKAPTGSLEERQAIVQAKRREALLLANTQDGKDRAGRYKRRDSDADLSISSHADQSEDALVYLHKVQKSDTLAGVIIKYNCQGEVFRKVNRFWPNDNIQTRSHVVIPVEACTARGRKVDSPYLTQDMFASGSSTAASREETTPFPILKGSENGGKTPPNLPPAGAVTSNTFSLTTSAGLISEEDFKHDSWVTLPSFPEPVEILRAPRQILGYFPRPRRKSITAPTPTSTTSTPKSSFDMLRHPPTHAAQISASMNASPVRHPISRLNSSTGRSRSTSATQSGAPSFADMLRGPGGVGSLRGLRTEISRPGPADDPLNKKFAPYLPNLAPPEDFPRTSLRPLSRSTPRASMDSIRSTRSNSSGLGEVGGAFEGWVRKMAGGPQRAKGVERMGDLIELETNTEGSEGAANGIVGEDVKTPTVTDLRGGSGSGGGGEASVRTTATEEALLNERFPVRGRIKNAYEGD